MATFTSLSLQRQRGQRNLNLEDLTVPAGNRLERLRGAQDGRYSIRVNDQYRVTFRWESGHASEVCAEDYH